MSNKNTIVSARTELEKQKDLELKEYPLTKELSKKIKDYYVNIIENLEGYEKKIIYDGKKIFLISGKDEIKDKNALKIFNTKYITKFGKIIKEFEFIPFSVWSKVIDDEFVIYDMQINDNWVYRDILEEEVEKVGMKIAPLVYQGKYEEKTIKERLSFPSIYTRKKINSLYIRSVIEGDVDKKRINFYTTDKSFDSIISKKNQNEVIKKVEEFIKEKVESSDSFLSNYWQQYLKSKDLSLDSKKSEIYRTIVYLCLSQWDVDLKTLSIKLGVKRSLVDKKVKAILPRYIRKILMEK